jgi:hypothetical protein
MIQTKDSLPEVVLVWLLERFVSLRKWGGFCGNNTGGLGIEALWNGGLRTVTAATEGNRIMRVDIIIKQ